MKVDLKAMTESQLTELIYRAKRRTVELKKKEAIPKLARKVEAMIESEGLSLKEILWELRKPGRTPVVPATGRSRKR
jgi:hypothetical protein